MARLGDICIIQSGGTPSRNEKDYWENGTIPWVKISDFSGKYLNHTSEKITQAGLDNSSAKIFSKGTILYTIFATLGETCILDIDATTNQAIAGLKLNDDSVSIDYLYYYLLSKKDYVNEIGRGVAQNNINMKILREMEITIPSEREQKSVTETLNKVYELIALRKQQLAKLDELVKSRFVELFDGKGYPTLKWNDVFNTTTGKLDSNAMVENGAYPFFTCAKEVFRIDKYAFDQEALLLAGNNAAGKYDVKYYKGKFNAYQRTYVLGLKEDWSYQLFRYQLEDKLVYLQQQSLGGLTKYLTLKILGELEFIVPPMDKQNEFAAFVEQTDKSKLAVQQSLDKLEELKKALMQEYFG